MNAIALPDESVVLDDTRRWLERAVIGLNLCPFAKAVHTKGQIHYAVSQARTPAELLADLRHALQDLVALDAQVRETSLLMAPFCLQEFLLFNDFLAQADQVLVDLRLDGVIQIAPFHPRFEFADAPSGDITHFTNRSPYPTLHLLRESSVARAVESFPEADMIYEKNLAAMKALGHAGWAQLKVGASWKNGG